MKMRNVLFELLAMPFMLLCSIAGDLFGRHHWLEPFGDLIAALDWLRRPKLPPLAFREWGKSVCESRLTEPIDFKSVLNDWGLE